MGLFIVLGIVALFLAVLFGTGGARVATEYERGVVFRLGRLIALKGPGMFFIVPFGVDRLVRIDLRTVTLEVPPQEIITNDNVTTRVNAVIYFQVVDPHSAVTRVVNYVNATSQIAQTTLRAVLGQSTLDELLANRDKVNRDLQRIIDEQTEPWGVKVSVVEIKDVELPQTMQRAMAKQAEAEREKRAKIINAEGEFQASQTLANAARVIQSEPGALQLRFLQTLTEIGYEKNTTIVFPLPIDLIRPFMKANELAGQGGAGSEQDGSGGETAALAAPSILPELLSPRPPGEESLATNGEGVPVAARVAATEGEGKPGPGPS